MKYRLSFKRYSIIPGKYFLTRRTQLFYDLFAKDLKDQRRYFCG